jgi:hypothetical protein
MSKQYRASNLSMAIKLVQNSMLMDTVVSGSLNFNIFQEIGGLSSFIRSSL